MVNLVYAKPYPIGHNLPDMLRHEVLRHIRHQVMRAEDSEGPPPPIQVEIHSLGMIATMTHETKAKVKKGLAPGDYKKVGADNPDIWVVSKKDDRIVLTRPKSKGKGKKYVTDVRAKDLLGSDWRDQINALSFLTNTRLRELVLDIQDGQASPDILNHEFIAFVRLGNVDWLAVPIY